MKIDFLGCDRAASRGRRVVLGAKKFFMKAKASIMVPSGVKGSSDSSPAWAEFFKSLLREDVSQVGNFTNFGY
jgi:hypothetical protein